MERRAARQERNGVLRLLSLELIFADERCAAALSDERLLVAMARFEAALAAASAQAGLIPASAAITIERVCSEARFDQRVLARDARNAGTLAIPFVKALKAQVHAVSAEAGRFLHFGATSEDVLDTALVLCLKEATARIAFLTVGLGDAAAKLARQYGDTPMPARTLLQPAAPVPFGWKAAMWLAPIARSYPLFCSAGAQSAVLQLGGAAGTLGALQDRGPAIASAMAHSLGLRYDVTWHSARERLARLGSELAILTGLSAKVARDVALLMQPEVGEAAEPVAPGRGGSSSMPHKRNPSLSLLALEASHRAPALATILLGELAPEHERGIGQWQSQWLTMRELACAAASALASVGEMVQGLEVHPDAMLENLARTNGLIYSEELSLRLSRSLADRLCEQAVREGRNLQEVVRSNAEASGQLGAEGIAAIFDPRRAFGAAETMIHRVLAEWTSARETSP